MKCVEIYTDGACSGNPGPGGYCAILVYMGKERLVSGGEKNTTNNRMELTAAIEGLKALKEPCKVNLYSDSQYLVNAINKGWLEGWVRKGFAKVKNPDLWIRFNALYKKHRVAFHWIKGHAGHPENERCDALAVAAGAGAVAAGAVLPPDAGYCPDEASLL